MSNQDGQNMNNNSVVTHKVQTNAAKEGHEPSEPMGQSECHSSIDVVTECVSSSQVRWFYKEPLGTSLWTPFGGFDTLIVEDAYRKLPSDLKTPKRCLRKSENNVTMNSEPTAEAEYASAYLKVPVMGGLYELDLLRRNISSVYWPGEVWDCTRGTWFYKNWQPLDEITADTIEQEHLKVFQGKKCPCQSSTQMPIHSQTFPDFSVDWYSPADVYFFSNRLQLMKTVTRKLGYFQKAVGTPIERAYKTLASESDKRKDISHLVFVVHGVGQVMNMNIGDRVFGNTCAIRERVTAMKEEYFPESAEYVEFFPVEWRSKVALDDGLIECITPPNIKYLRRFINTSAMDIMYYMSPIYCGEIQDCVASEMNRLHSIFSERNPQKNPKVSVVAHSLGAVIMYDIVTGYLPQGFTKVKSFEPGKSRLNFSLDNFFCFGSPLAVFLAMRAKKGNHGKEIFPPSMCNRLYNIYHFTDPIAYRLEPLADEAYCRIAPIPIQQYNCAKPKRYSDMPLVPEGVDYTSSISGSAPEYVPSPDDSVVPADSAVLPIEEVPADLDSLTIDAMPGPSTQIAESTSSPLDQWKNKGRNIWKIIRNDHNYIVRSSSCVTAPTIGALDHRLDFVLTSGATGALIIKSVLVSHMAYWSDNDVALFVLTRIFPKLEEELCSEEIQDLKRTRKRKHLGNTSADEVSSKKAHVE